MVFVTSILLLFSTLCFAQTQVVAKIHSIDRGLKGEETLYFLTSGDVISTSDQKISVAFEKALKNTTWLRIDINKSGNAERITEENPPYKMKKNGISKIDQEMYEPTVVENMEIATSYFREAKYSDKESECFNRAHIWSYEWFINHGVNSNKTWIFFTRQYIRKFKFKWWFHVAPSLQVLENGFPRDKILDIKYARGPVSIKTWSDIFMRNKAACPYITTYSDYANYPESASCYIMNTSMFYYQPFDIESRETWGTIRANWYDPEIQQAYADALEEKK